ncbi:Cache domain-containing protein [Marinitoga hydrogenitolerans DSM 16785]|uniref:Cache domain-containing protein n=1 Tax=Marinitoga hydrogenitolerans (strain DSM 16785 / JCM 12826 / AT1271) TaxID=1122195 RepID=A0A1M4ULD8_MARH1|nr:HD domain-containing phosphohydrolase [Marinitoga hydrogenitolerans]SHE57478.1 Cache domain-containing protein [Marinitoga hydrogenitolerans DSM 16785]
MEIKKFFDSVIITLFIIILSIGIFFTYESYKNEESEKIKDLKKDMNIISNRLFELVENKKYILENIDNLIRETEDIKKIIKTIYDFNKFDLKYAYFSSTKGDLYVYPKINIPKNFNPLNKDWYKLALNNKKVIISHSYETPEQKKIVFTLSKVIKKEGKVIGVVGLDLNSEKINEMLKSTVQGKYYNFYIIKKSNRELLFNNTMDKNEIKKIEIKKEFDVVKYDDNIYAYSEIIPDIYIISQFNIDILKTNVIKRMSIFVLISILIIVIFRYVYYNFLIKNVIKPILVISESMNNFSLNIKEKKVPYFSNKYKIKEINLISESYEKLIGTMIASFMNFELLTDEIKKVYNRLKNVNEMFYEIIKLITMLDNEDLMMEEYFESVLNYVINHIEEAKYGSISIIKNGKWQYIAAIGHNIEILKNLEIEMNIDLKGNRDTVNVLSFDEIFNYDKDILNKDVVDKLELATKKFKYALIYITDLEGCSLVISVETIHEKGFSKDSQEIFKAYVNLAKIFLYKKFELTKIENIYFNFAEKLASIAEGHDDITGKHIYRVGEISAFLAEKMGYDETFVEKIRKFSPLHDIGKIYVPYEILNKKGKLTDEEFEIMKKHTLHAKDLFADDRYFDMALNISLYHHENCDGSGYPYGLKCEQIPIEAAIVKIADIYDALRAKRPYKESLSHEKCVEIIIKGDNRTNPAHFHKEILEIFKNYHNELDKIWNEINNSGGENSGIKN